MIFRLNLDIYNNSHGPSYESTLGCSTSFICLSYILGHIYSCPNKKSWHTILYAQVEHLAMKLICKANKWNRKCYTILQIWNLFISWPKKWVHEFINSPQWSEYYDLLFQLDVLAAYCILTTRYITLSGETLSGETIHQAKFSSLNEIFVTFARRKVSPDEKFRPKGFFIFLVIVGLWTTTQTIQKVKTPKYFSYWPKWLHKWK